MKRMTPIHRTSWVACIMFALSLAGCDRTRDDVTILTLATTTSTRDSGLLDVLIPVFEQETGINVKVVAVGSGQALELGRRGDADVLLTHAPAAEDQFVANGYGESRRDVMHNDFVLVGPAADPGQARGQTRITDVFRLMQQNQVPFVSRGDESGTHIKEKQIWEEVGTTPHGPSYIQAGAGMAEVLRIANEKQAYTLSDRGTFLAHQGRLDLVVLFEGDRRLRNPYAVIVARSARNSGAEHPAAHRFAEFLLSPHARDIIREFGVEKYGQPLFVPHGL